MASVIAPESANPVYDTCDQVVLDIAANTQPVIGLSQLDKDVLNYILRLMDVARHEYSQFEQITFVLVIDLSKRIAIAPSESQDKQLIFQHCALLFNE